MHRLSKHYLGAAKEILYYISRIINYGICYSQVIIFKLIDFIDSNWTNSLDNRKNTSKSIFNLRSRAITWSSTKQVTIALLSFETNYVAIASSVC